MKKQIASASTRVNFPTLLYRPDRVRSLLRATKLELERFHDREISYEELGRFAGQAASTVFEKLQRSDHPQIEALLGWFERLPDPVRSDLLSKSCRCFTSLEHPKLSHDPVQVSTLKDILSQPFGITLITGGNEGLRSFVLSALGQSGLRLGPQHRPVVGIDKLKPDWFVPVDGVIYLNGSMGQLPCRDRVLEAWRATGMIQQRLVLLNGIVSAAMELKTHILSLSQNCNVFVSDEQRAIDQLLPGKNLAPARRLAVSPWNGDHIHITVHDM